MSKLKLVYWFVEFLEENSSLFDKQYCYNDEFFEDFASYFVEGTLELREQIDLLKKQNTELKKELLFWKNS